ncbi:MAG: HD domain-containing protein [Bacteroidota bacterium]
MMGNILETQRLVANYYRETRHPDGMLMTSFLLDLCSALWHVGEVRDQRVLAAGLLHRIIVDGLLTAPEFEAMFGAEIAAMVALCQNADALDVPQFQRLQGAKARQRVEAARQIMMAVAIARVRQAGQQQRALSDEVWQNLQKEIEPFAHTLPKMQAFLAGLFG